MASSELTSVVRTPDLRCPENEGKLMSSSGTRGRELKETRAPDAVPSCHACYAIIRDLILASSVDIEPLNFTVQ